MPARRRVDTSLITRITTGQRSIAMSVSVCLSVRDDIFATVRPIFNCFFCTWPHEHTRSMDAFSGGVMIRYIFLGFMDDVISANQPRLVSTSPPSCAELPQRTRSLGLGYKLCAVILIAGQRTHGTTSRTRIKWQQRGRSVRSMAGLLLTGVKLPV